METDHYKSLAYYRLIENADQLELPRISGTAYSLFGTEFNDQDELAGIFTQLVEQTISLEGKKIYLSIVLRLSYSSEKMYHYHKLWRYLKRWYDLSEYTLGREYLVSVCGRDLYCGAAEIPLQELRFALGIILERRFTSFLYITDEEKDLQGEGMRDFFLAILREERYSVPYDYVKIFERIKAGETIVDVSTDMEEWAVRIEEKEEAEQ